MWKEIATIIHMDPENSDLSDPESAIPTIRDMSNY